MNRPWFILAFTILTALAVACGGSSGSDSTNAGLQSRAESQAKAQSDKNWAEWYGFFSPDNKSVCSESEFVAAAGPSMASFEESSGLEESDRLEFRIVDVTLNATQGVVSTEIYLNDELLFDNLNEPWVYADGEWWSISSIPECRIPSPTPAPAVKPNVEFDKSAMSGLVSVEEVEAAIPGLIEITPTVTDLSGFAGDAGMAGKDSIWGKLFSSTAGAQLMVIVTDFASPETLQQQIAVWTARDSMRFTEPIIGDGSLQGQEGDNVSVRVWKGDKVVFFSATDLPGTPEVLDGLFDLAELAASRLSSK
jgi:hypothetical protein